MGPMFYHDAQLSFQQSLQQFQQQQQLQFQQSQCHPTTTTNTTLTQPFNLIAGGCDGNFHPSMSLAMGPLQYHQHPSTNPLLVSSSLQPYTALNAGMIPHPTSHLNYPSTTSSSTDVYLDHSFGLGVGACDLASVDLHWLNFATETTSILSEPSLSDPSKYIHTNNTMTTTTNNTNNNNHVVTESEETSAEPDDDSVVSGILEAFAE